MTLRPPTAPPAAAPPTHPTHPSRASTALTATFVAAAPASSARAVDPRLRADLAELLDGPALGWAVARVRARAASGDGLDAVMQLLTATPVQRSAAAALLGPSCVRGTRVAVRLEDVEELLRELVGWEGGLAAAVRALDDDVVVLPEAPAAVATPSPVVLASPVAAPAAAVVPVTPVMPPQDRAPSRGPNPTPASAAPPAPPPRAHVAVAAPSAPSAVTAAGRELTDVVLALGLPATPAGATGAALAAWRAVGQPVVLTARQLRTAPPVWRQAPKRGTVFVCPDPDVLATIADACPPEQGRAPVAVVCLLGPSGASGGDGAAGGDEPGDAVRLVLRQLRAAGWTLRLNAGDGDAGRARTSRLAAELRARPWRGGPDVRAGDDRLAVADPSVPLREQLAADVRRS